MSFTRLSRRYHEWLVDAAVAGAVGVAATLATGPYGVVGLGHGLLMAAALLWRRRHPTAVFAVVALLAAAQLLAGSVFTLLLHDVAVLVAMYSVVTYARRLWEGALAGAVALLGAVLAGASLSTATDAGWYLTTYLAVVCAGVWLLALAVRTRRLYVLSLEERAATAERERDHLARIAVIEERARIARELHDIVAHSLSVMIVHADGATYALDPDPERARAALRTISATGREALGEMRQLVEVLRSPDRPDSGAGDRRPGALDQVAEAVERARAAGLDVELTRHGRPAELPDGVALAVSRIAQEALTNTLKHAGAGARAWLTVSYRATAVELQLDDDGGGDGRAARDAGSTEAALPDGGHGLVGMRERVAFYNGQFAAGPRDGGGWRVRALLPVPPAPAQPAAVQPELSWEA